MMDGLRVGLPAAISMMPRCCASTAFESSTTVKTSLAANQLSGSHVADSR
jgi:hypothetical protein